ncbi:TIGR03617 family F420-dependent LLM class oxidoreductase [Parahaliea maris]|uniref:TIGR03617 family F420-dependent LLM class oxidoreductase n=1 Tax=Parahaliea maris TaxID=2716870 RepID=A0A5C9A7N1_9GAMM|nr:TIGR03617 family F420-dependent LLM class oxidoreductase [Parahaliea maris]TXS95670.1 TIGR03617 family F420-dependent LLM class oxidoreductase [Parahaliea maris]
MKIDGPLYSQLENVAAEAARMADLGYDGLYTLEGSSDPFLPLVLAAQQAPGLDIATGIAVAFPRNPLHLAYQAWDLQRYSGGHFLLGLGSQVRAHIEKRFGVDFDPPAPRMRDYILALRAIFRCWQHAAPLDYQGRFFRHTLMTPMFNPGPNPHGMPPVLLGALGPRMTEVAGEVADGLIVHPFNNPPFLEQQALPAVARGLERTRRHREDFILQINAVVITGDSDAAIRAARDSVRGLLGFYASTPAYRPPMDAIGKGHLQPELNRLSKAGEWDALAEYIDDEFLAAFAVEGPPESIAGQLIERYGGMADRLALYIPYQAPDNVWRRIITDLKHAGSGGDRICHKR